MAFTPKNDDYFGVHFEMVMYRRTLRLELPPGQSAFPWGPRKTGKSTLRGIRAFCEEHEPAQAMVVTTEPAARQTPDGIRNLPWRLFLEELWSDRLLPLWRSSCPGLAVAT